MLMSFVNKSLSSEETDNFERNSLLSRCYRRLGDWQLSLAGDPSPLEVTEIIESYHMATKYNPGSYKGWHAWAFMNYEALNLLKYQKRLSSGSNSPPPSIDVCCLKDLSSVLLSHLLLLQMTLSYASAAVHGFFKSIALSVKSSLQDTLRYGDSGCQGNPN